VSIGASDAAFAAMSDVVLAVTGERSLPVVLDMLVHASRDLVGARYAALGIPDEEGTGFSQFLTSGMSDELIEEIGPLPRTHGLLGAMLADPNPHRTDDIQSDPRFQWWPAAHPVMRSFLGVPVVAHGDVVAAFYLTDKIDAPTFSDGDQQVIELLAAHAAVAIENARLFEASRELSIVEERNRLARELHDTMTQNLFSLSLTAEAARDLVRSDPVRAEEELGRVRALARDTMAELRSIVFELRPAQLEADGLVVTLEKHLAIVARTYDLGAELHVDGDDSVVGPDEQLELFRIVQEALTNVVRHAEATKIVVDLELRPDRVTLVVRDDGRGFDPATRGIRARRLGLTSMHERADAIGGRFAIESAPGGGTEVRVEVPRGDR
jgi:signal transduction histidine kinase